MKAIVIREPYVSLILSGEKTWEMRKAACRYRGLVALISKGSGTVVGTAEIVDSLPSIESLEAYADSEPKHGVLPNLQRQAFSDGWRTPWVLNNARRLPAPVRYKHPSGAVIWVTLDEHIAAEVLAQTQQSPSASQSSRTHMDPPSGAPPLCHRGSMKSHATNNVQPEAIRKVTITGGNIRNKHIYLPLDFFPEQAIGGSNKSELASQSLSVAFRPGQTIETDIDGAKRIFRARSAVGEFFAAADVAEGDVVCLTKTGAFSFEVSKETNG
jgi:hypothetical protein